MSFTRSAAVATLLFAGALTTGCGTFGDLEPTSRDSVPTQVGKTIVLIPAVVGLVCFEIFASGVRHRSEAIERNEELGHGEIDYYRDIY